MKAITWLSAVLLLGAVACKKKEDKAAETPPKVVDKAKPEPVKPAPAADMTVTSKSPEAIKEFEAGRALFDNQRAAEGRDHLKKAIELDPEFALATTYLGFVTPGAEGTELLAKAGTLSAKLPEAEKLFIEGSQALRAGDRAKGLAAFQKASELAPGSWRLELQVADLLNNAGERDKALQHLDHALQTKPDLATAYNVKAYIKAAQREWEPAIAAAKKQVELLPKEPNPRDTLAEILLWSGKFDEAEKEFTAAVTMEPKFTIAWQGIGLSRAYRGDYKGAYEAFDKRKASTEPGEKYEALIDRAWTSLAENKLPQALAALDEIEKDPAAKKLPIYAFGALNRAHILNAAGKYPEASKQFAVAITRTEPLAGDGRLNLTRGHRFGVLRLAALTGKPGDADKLVAEVEEDQKTHGDPNTAPQFIGYAKGLAAWAKKDLKTAAAEMAKCDPDLLFCRADLAAVQRKAGDKAGAEATEKLIRETPRRDPAAVYVLAHLPKP